MTAVRYYNDKYNEIKNIEAFLHKNQTESGKGELYIKEFKGIKLVYDLNTGKVQLVPIKSPQGITEVYSATAFKSITAPLSIAISLLAKLQLLLKLKEIGSEAIAQLVCHHHIDPKNSTIIHFDSVNVNGTLVELIHLPHSSALVSIEPLKRKHKVICDKLVEFGIHNINSLNDVKMIMEKITEALHKQKASKRKENLR